jgi:8-oxo-dGTP diphosphatase
MTPHTPSTAKTEIALALVWRGTELLITRRPSHVHQGGLWEFPGGKCRAGEAALVCAVREVHEEVGLSVRALRARSSFSFSYPDRELIFHAVDCVWEKGAVSMREVVDFAWVSVAELCRYTFPPANAGLIDDLVRHGPGRI